MKHPDPGDPGSLEGLPLQQLHRNALRLASQGQLIASSRAYDAIDHHPDEYDGILEQDPLLNAAIMRDRGMLATRIAVRLAVVGDHQGRVGTGTLPEHFEAVEEFFTRSFDSTAKAMENPGIPLDEIDNSYAATMTCRGRSLVARWAYLPVFGTDSHDADNYVSRIDDAFDTARLALGDLEDQANPYFKASLGMNAARWAILQERPVEARKWRRYAVAGLRQAVLERDGANARSSLRTIVTRWQSTRSQEAAVRSLAPRTAFNRPRLRVKI